MTIDADALRYEQDLMAGLIAPEGVTPQDETEYRDRLHYFLQHVPVELLSPESQSLVQCLSAFQDKTSGVGLLDEASLLDMLMSAKAPVEKQARYVELFAAYSTKVLTTARFRYSVTRFMEVKEELRFIAALNQTFTVHTQGAEVGKGRTKRKLNGYKDAKSFLLNELNEIELGFNSASIPEGDLHDAADTFVEEAEARRSEPTKFSGVKCGIAAIDDVTNGAKPGELITALGYTEVGKTFFCINWAHHAQIEQGMNVVAFTAEVPKEQYQKRRFLRFCRNPAYGLPQGIDADSFKNGRLSPQEIQGIRRAMDDYKTNPKYGKFYVVQVPSGAPWQFIENKLNVINSLWANCGGVQFCVVDSLNLIVPQNQDENVQRVALNKMIKRAKQFAMTFDKGRGVPIISPWHANRKSWEQAVKDGKYKLNSASEADELEKSVDLFIWLLKMPNSGSTHEIVSGIEKYRDGRGQMQFTLYEDFASSYIGTVAVATTPASGPSTAPPTFVQATPSTQSAATVTPGTGGFDARMNDLF